MGQLTPGTKCDRYDIVRLIGAGGMGEVYQAMHEFTKKQVALKVLKTAHAGMQQHVEKMRSEAMVLCSIKHVNLVEVYDAGFADVDTTSGRQSLIWMAMELLEGESLRERLVREGALRPALALEWAAQIADGVQAAHDAHVIHRDLKPENIFITKKGDIRVLDFGTAKFNGIDHRHAADQVGTIPYMSPEQLNGDELDGRSDVYAVGFILYEMLAGRHPFSDAQGGFPSVDQLLPMALAGEPDSLATHIGADAWHTLACAFHKDREARFATMAAASHAFRQHAKAYGTETSGVALRLSGSTSTTPVVGGTDRNGRPSAVSAVGSSYANLTPPPFAAGIPPAPPRGVTAGAILGMAVGAAGLGALLVILLHASSPTASASPRADNSSTAAATSAAATSAAATSATATGAAATSAAATSATATSATATSASAKSEPVASAAASPPTPSASAAPITRPAFPPRPRPVIPRPTAPLPAPKCNEIVCN